MEKNLGLNGEKLGISGEKLGISGEKLGITPYNLLIINVLHAPTIYIQLYTTNLLQL